MKRANGQGTLPYRLPNGRWRAEVTVGWTANGKRKRRSVVRDTAPACEDALRALLNERDAGTLTIGASPTLGDWLSHWLDEIAAPSVRPSTLQGYRSKITTWIAGTTLARKRLDKVTPEDLDALYSRMRAEGRAGSTVQMHRILARALRVAVRRGKIAVSPAERMDAPTAKPFEAHVFTLEETRRLIAAASASEEGLRWMVALATGVRQGERLGLGWDNFDLDAKTFTVTRTLERRPYRHGCDGTCGERRGVDCPKAIVGGLFFGVPKSRAGTRRAALPEPLVEALREQWARTADRPPYTDPAGVTVHLVFSQANGRPINPRDDWEQWRAFLAAQGVPVVRVHDARHTAATVMLMLGQDPRVVMELMGWSQVSMLARYQHVVDELRRDAATAVGSALWAAPVEPEPPLAPNVISIDAARRKRSS